MTHSMETVAKAQELHLMKLSNREVARRLKLAARTMNTWVNNIENLGRFRLENFKARITTLTSMGIS